MTITAGGIKIDLTLNDTNYSVTVKNVDRLLGQLERRFQQTGQSVDRLDRHFSSLFTRFRHGVQMFAALRFALIDIHDVFLSLPAAVLKSTGEIERMTQLMAGLSKETDATARRLEGISNVNFAFNLAKNAPFEVKAITDAMVKFKAAGLDPTNGSLQALLEGVAQFGGTSETLHRASIAIQQMAGKGVISMEELRQQLGEAVPTAMRSMADGMGITMVELVKRISKGTVESKSALAIMFADMEARARGSAQDMMGTWSGMTQRLATEWELFKNEVGQAGFLQAAKESVKEIIDLLRSPGAIQFAATIGRDLAQIIRGLIDLANWVQRNEELLKALGLTLVAVWGGNKLRNVLGDAMGALSGFAVKNGQVKFEIIKNQAEIDAAYLRSKLAQQANVLEIAQLQARAAAAEAVVNSGRLANGRFASAAYVTMKRSEIQVILDKINALNAENVAMARNATISRGLGTVLGFITGPLGLIATMLSIGASLWMAYGDSAEDAFLKIRRAAQSGQGTGENLKEANKQLTEQTALVERLGREIAAMESGSGETEGGAVAGRAGKRGDFAQRLAKKREELIAAETKMHELRFNANQINAQIDERGVKQQVSIWQDGLTERERQINHHWNRVIDENMKRFGDEKNLTTAQQEQLAKETREFRIKNLRELVDHYEQEYRTHQNASRNENDLQARKAAEALTRKNQLEERLRAVSKGPQFMEKKGDGKGSSSLNPFERHLAQAKADLEALTKANSFLLKGEQVIETEAAIRDRIAAKINKQVEEGVYTLKDKDGKTTFKPSPEQVEELIRIETKNTILEKQKPILEALIKKNEELAEAERDSFLVLREGMDEGTTNAMQSLKKFFIDLGIQMGLTGEALERFNTVKEKALQMQGTIDLNKFVGGFVEKTRQMNVELLETDRERLEAQYQREVDQAKRQMKLKEDTLRQQYEDEEKYLAKVSEAHLIFYAYLEALAKKHARDMESPMEKLARQWKDVTKQMQDASTGWANQTIDVLVNFVKTGKLEFSKLADSILTDILRIQMQKRLADPINTVIEEGIKFLGPLLSGGSSTPQFGDNPEFFAAANGGVMSQFGAVALRRYARGGIANSPQLAIFGEGSTPEAYVPLPDGRAIPVKMDGVMPTVNVNVINQSGVPVNARAGEPRMDGRQMVLDVVLSATNTPGPFRDGMKQALGA